MTAGKLKMEDNLTFFENGRRPHFFCKFKTTSHFLQMEDDLNFSCKMEGNLIFKKKMKDTLDFSKWK
jgi:hypothetical protein